MESSSAIAGHLRKLCLGLSADPGRTIQIPFSKLVFQTIIAQALSNKFESCHPSQKHHFIDIFHSFLVFVSYE